MEQGVERLYAGIAPLVESGRLGPVLWQLPANFRRDDDRLGVALERLPPGATASSSAHASWFTPEVYGLLHTFGVALVLGDDPRRPLPPHELTADWTYLRLHRGRRGRRGNYSETELRDVGRADRASCAARSRSSRTSTTTGRGSRCATRVRLRALLEGT